MSYEKTSFGPITSQYPDIDIQMKYEAAPFHKRSDKRPHNQAHIYAGTIYNGIPFRYRHHVDEVRFEQFRFNPTVVIDVIIYEINKAVQDFKNEPNKHHTINT